VLALLLGLVFALQAGKARFGFIQQGSDLLLTQETVALRCEPFEELENASGSGEALALLFALLQLLLRRGTFAFQTRKFGQPLALLLQLLELLLQGLEFVELRLVFSFQGLPLFRLQRL